MTWNTFTNGTVANAGSFNDNFQYVNCYKYKTNGIKIAESGTTPYTGSILFNGSEFIGTSSIIHFDAISSITGSFSISFSGNSGLLNDAGSVSIYEDGFLFSKSFLGSSTDYTTNTIYIESFSEGDMTNEYRAGLNDAVVIDINNPFCLFYSIRPITAGSLFFKIYHTIQ